MLLGSTGGVNEARVLNSQQGQPIGADQGDITLNASGVPGGPGMFYNAPDPTTPTLSGVVTPGTTTSVGVSACPTTTLPATYTSISDRSGPFPVQIGLLTSCVGTTLTFLTVNHAAKSGDTIQFVNAYPAALIANDPAGTKWTLGNTMKLTPVAIASLPTCGAGAACSFAVVNNGAAPTYGGAVGTTGAVTSPVFCTGSGWIYPDGRPTV